MTDNANHPAHYMTDKGIETIDVIEAFTSNLLGIEAVCTANVIKYICRWKKKNGIEDLKKAQWYLTRLIDHMEEKHTCAVENAKGFVREYNKWQKADSPERKVK